MTTYRTADLQPGGLQLSSLPRDPDGCFVIEAAGRRERVAPSRPDIAAFLLARHQQASRPARRDPSAAALCDAMGSILARELAERDARLQRLERAAKEAKRAARRDPIGRAARAIATINAALAGPR